MTEEIITKSITPKWLLLIHSIVLVLIAIFLIDVSFFYSSLLPYMGMDTLLLPVYLLIFELPHIIASLLTFADKSYVKFYKNHLLFGLLPVLFIVSLLFYLNPVLTFLIYIIATMYHVIRQQTGIASILTKVKGIWFHLWTSSLIVATSTTLTLLAMPYLFNKVEVRQLSLVALFSVVFSLLTAAVYAWQAKTKIGRLFILATSVLLIVSYFFTLVGYIFFAFFLYRFVHDITAFTFYVVHDHNRNVASVKNSFYGLFKKIRLPFLLAVPLSSILIALLIRIGISETSIALAAIVLLGFAHYYVEAIMWRRDSPHRQQIIFSK